MQKKQNLIYRPEIVQNVYPFLDIKDILVSSLVSKQFNYMLKKYIRKCVLPANQNPNANEYALLKAYYYRKVYCFNKNSDEFVQLKVPAFVKQIQCQSAYTILEGINGQYSLAITKSLFSQEKIKLIALPKKMEIVKACGDSGIYCFDGHNLIRYKNQSQEELPPPFSNEEVYPMQYRFQKIICSFECALVFFRKVPDLLSVSISNKNEALNHLIELKLPFDLYNLDYENQITVGNSRGYIINNETLYEIDLKTSEVKEYLPLSGKKIVKIMGGRNHFIAHERSKNLTDDWSNNDVIEWAKAQGFDDYIKIFKSEKIIGKKLLSMDKKYMEDVLGITSHKIQQKMLLRIAECNEQDPNSYILHAWGINNNGQLCTNVLTKDINTPNKLKIPADSKVYKCQANETFIINKKSNAISVSVGGKAFSWKAVTDKKVFSMSVYKNFIILVAAAKKDKIPQNLSAGIEVVKKQKLRTAKNIIDKISWDEHIQKQDFRIGYLDGEQGLLQMPFVDFQNSQIKEYRIEYFKRGNEIVWSKKERIDIL